MRQIATRLQSREMSYGSSRIPAEVRETHSATASVAHLRRLRAGRRASGVRAEVTAEVMAEVVAEVMAEVVAKVVAKVGWV